jgi:hypothetical protein
MTNEKKQSLKGKTKKNPQAEANGQDKKGSKEEVKPRQILIETDGNNVRVARADVAGSLELIAILSIILEDIKLKAKQ